ncbi:MAG: hypothetical protein R3C11_05090 [Planctomycetaceae bacterium]
MIRPEKLDRIANTKIGNRIDLKKQFDYQRRGDLNRRLDLGLNLRNQGGWRNRAFIGGVNSSFTHTHFSSWYVGPGFYPRYCWTPRWSSWVSWSWGITVTQSAILDQLSVVRSFASLLQSGFTTKLLSGNHCQSQPVVPGLMFHQHRYSHQPISMFSCSLFDSSMLVT